jgi:hypothetical protein
LNSIQAYIGLIFPDTMQGYTVAVYLWASAKQGELTMAVNNSKTSCPFCNGVNKCMAESESPCWCFKLQIPKSLTALLPIGGAVNHISATPVLMLLKKMRIYSRKNIHLKQI